MSTNEAEVKKRVESSKKEEPKNNAVEIQNNPLLDALASHKAPLILSKSRRLAIVVNKKHGEGLLPAGDSAQAQKSANGKDKDSMSVNIEISDEDVEINVFRSGPTKVKVKN